MCGGARRVCRVAALAETPVHHGVTVREAAVERRVLFIQVQQVGVGLDDGGDAVAADLGLDQCLRQIYEPEACGRADGKVPVLIAADALVETHGFPHGAVHEHGLRAGAVLGQKVLQCAPRMRRVHGVVKRAAARGDAIHAAVAQIRACCHEQIILLLQLVRVPEIVAVLKGENAAMCALRAEVAGITRAAVLLVAHVVHARVAGRVKQVLRAVGRGIVHDDDLEICIRLRQNALDAGGQLVLAVVGRDDDRDQIVHRLPPFTAG